MGRSLDPVRSVTGLLYSLKNQIQKHLNRFHQNTGCVYRWTGSWNFDLSKTFNLFYLSLKKLLNKQLELERRTNHINHVSYLSHAVSLTVNSHYNLECIMLPLNLFYLSLKRYGTLFTLRNRFIKWLMKINRRFKSEYTWWNLMLLAWIQIEIFS